MIHEKQKKSVPGLHESGRTWETGSRIHLQCSARALCAEFVSRESNVFFWREKDEENKNRRRGMAARYYQRVYEIMRNGVVPPLWQPPRLKVARATSELTPRIRFMHPRVCVRLKYVQRENDVHYTRQYLTPCPSPLSLASLSLS